MGECTGSDKAFAFRLCKENTGEVHVFESAIDLLSFASWCALRGKNWKKMSLLSLGGVAPSPAGSDRKRVPAALINYLDRMPGTGRIILHLDNDEAGRLATKQITEALAEQFEVIDDPAPRGKDFNDFLCMKKGILIKGKTEREGEER